MERKPISKVQHAALQRRTDALFEYAAKLGVNLRLKFIYPKGRLAPGWRAQVVGKKQPTGEKQ